MVVYRLVSNTKYDPESNAAVAGDTTNSATATNCVSLYDLGGIP